MRRSVIVTLLVTTTLVLTAVSIDAAPRPDGGPPVFTPVAKVHDLMALNQDFYKSLQTNLQGGSPDWEKAGHEARLMAEIANVLQYHHPPSEADWWRFAGAYGEGAKRLVEAAEAKKSTEAVGAHAALFSSCKQCHNKYRK